MWILISIFAIIVLILILGVISIMNTSKCNIQIDTISEREMKLRRYINNKNDLEEILKDNINEDIHLSQLYTSQYLLLTDAINNIDVKEELKMNGLEFKELTGNNEMYNINMRLYDYITNNA